MVRANIFYDMLEKAVNENFMDNESSLSMN